MLEPEIRFREIAGDFSGDRGTDFVTRSQPAPAVPASGSRRARRERTRHERRLRCRWRVSAFTYYNFPVVPVCGAIHATDHATVRSLISVLTARRRAVLTRRDAVGVGVCVWESAKTISRIMHDVLCTISTGQSGTPHSTTCYTLVRGAGAWWINLLVRGGVACVVES